MTCLAWSVTKHFQDQCHGHLCYLQYSPYFFSLWLFILVYKSHTTQDFLSPGVAGSRSKTGGKWLHQNSSAILSYVNLLAIRSFFSRQASLARQGFLITALHGTRSKTGKTLSQKSSAMYSYVKLMRQSQHWYFPQFRCNMWKISAKRYVWANDRGTRHSWNQNRRGRWPSRFRFTDDEFRGHYAT